MQRLKTKLLVNETESRSVGFVLSTAGEDRVGDTIQQDGWQLSDYKKNPVVLWAHNDRQPPIGKCTNLRVTARGLEASVVFATADENPLADTVFKLVKGGFINAGSVGFRPLEYEATYDAKGNFQGLNFVKQELTEFSIVSVPCNADALVSMRSADAAHLALLAKGYDDAADDTARAAIVASAMQRTPRPFNFSAHKAALNNNRARILQL